MAEAQPPTAQALSRSDLPDLVERRRRRISSMRCSVKRHATPTREALLGTAAAQVTRRLLKLLPVLLRSTRCPLDALRPFRGGRFIAMPDRFARCDWQS